MKRDPCPGCFRVELTEEELLKIITDQMPDAPDVAMRAACAVLAAMEGKTDSAMDSL